MMELLNIIYNLLMILIKKLWQIALSVYQPLQENDPGELTHSTPS